MPHRPSLRHVASLEPSRLALRALSLCALWGLLFSYGCSAYSVTASSWRNDLHDSLAIRGLDPAKITVPFAISREGLSWLDAHLQEDEAGGRAQGSSRQRLDRLLTVLLAENGLGLHYERSFTGTADEVLARRKANCLGFVNLFVALARERGLPAYFLAVEDRPLYGREGDLVLVSDHVAAGFGTGQDMVLLDFAETPTEYKKIRQVSDLEAVAKYYSNRGAEMLREGREREAREWLEVAVKVAPEMASGWVNLGVARRRTGDLPGAELAYKSALEADPQTVTAYQNLAALLRLKGEPTEALRLLAITDRLSNRNPYSFLSLGDWNRESGRFDEARRLYRRALALDATAAEPYAAMGELELACGKPERARRWLKKAQKLDPEDQRASTLEHRLTSRI